MTYVILVNYNGWQDTIQCLESILVSSITNFKVIVIDNHSIDDSFTKLSLWAKNKGEIVSPLLNTNDQDTLFVSVNSELNDNETCWDVVIIRSDVNNGFAAGNNTGVRFIQKNELDYDNIWLLNNDTIIDFEALENYVRRMKYEVQMKSNVGILGGKLLFHHDRSILQGIGGNYNKFIAAAKPIGWNQKDTNQYEEKDVKFDYVIGASMFVNKSFINEVGLMKEDYFLYFEELDWTLRGRKKGWKIGYEPTVKVYHKESASTTGDCGISLIADKYQLRNRIVFTYRFYPILLLTVLPVTFISVFNRIIRKQYKRSWQLLVLIFITICQLKKWKDDEE